MATAAAPDLKVAYALVPASDPIFLRFRALRRQVFTLDSSWDDVRIAVEGECGDATVDVVIAAFDAQPAASMTRAAAAALPPPDVLLSIRDLAGCRDVRRMYVLAHQRGAPLAAPVPSPRSLPAAPPLADDAVIRADVTAGINMLRPLVMPLLRVAHACVYGASPALEHGVADWLPLSHACVWSNVGTAFALPCREYLRRRAVSGGVLHFRPDDKPLSVGTQMQWELLPRIDRERKRAPHVAVPPCAARPYDLAHPVADAQCVCISNEDIAQQEVAVWCNALNFFPNSRFPLNRASASNTPSAPPFIAQQFFNRAHPVPADAIAALCDVLRLPAPTAGAHVPISVSTAASMLSRENHASIRHKDGNVADPVTSTDAVRVLVFATRLAAAIAGQWAAWQASGPRHPALLAAAIAAEDCSAQLHAAVSATKSITAILRSVADGTCISATIPVALRVPADYLHRVLNSHFGITRGPRDVLTPVRVLVSLPHTNPAGALCVAPWDVVLDLADGVTFDVASTSPPSDNESLTVAMAAVSRAMGSSLATRSTHPERIVALYSRISVSDDVPHSWAAGLTDVKLGSSRIFAPLVGRAPLIAPDGTVSAHCAAVADAVAQLADHVVQRAAAASVRIMLTVLLHPPGAAAVRQASTGLWSFDRVGIDGRVQANTAAPLLARKFVQHLALRTRTNVLIVTDSHIPTVDSLNWLLDAELGVGLGRLHVVNLSPASVEMHVLLSNATDDAVHAGIFVPGMQPGAWELLSEPRGGELWDARVLSAKTLHSELQRAGLHVLHRHMLQVALSELQFDDTSAAAGVEATHAKLRTAAIDFACGRPAAWPLLDNEFLVACGLGDVASAPRASAQAALESSIVRAWDTMRHARLHWKRVVVVHPRHAGGSTMARRALWNLTRGRLRDGAAGIVCAVLSPRFGDLTQVAQAAVADDVALACQVCGQRPIVVLADRDVPDDVVNHFEAAMATVPACSVLLLRLCHSEVVLRHSDDRVFVGRVEEADMHDVNRVWADILTLLQQPQQSPPADETTRMASPPVARPRNRVADEWRALRRSQFLRVYGFIAFSVVTQHERQQVEHRRDEFVGELVDALALAAVDRARRGALRLLAYLALFACTRPHECALLAPLVPVLDDELEHLPLRACEAVARRMLHRRACEHAAMATNNFGAASISTEERHVAVADMLFLYNRNVPLSDAAVDRVLPRERATGALHVAASDRVTALVNTQVRELTPDAVRAAGTPAVPLEAAGLLEHAAAPPRSEEQLLSELIASTTVPVAGMGAADDVAWTELVYYSPGGGVRMYSEFAPAFLRSFLVHEAAAVPATAEFNPLQALVLCLLRFIAEHHTAALWYMFNESLTASGVTCRSINPRHPADVLLRAMLERDGHLHVVSGGSAKSDHCRCSHLLTAVVPHGSDISWGVTSNSTSVRPAGSSAADIHDAGCAVELLLYAKHALPPQVHRSILWEVAHLQIPALVAAQSVVLDLMRTLNRDTRCATSVAEGARVAIAHAAIQAGLARALAECSLHAVDAGSSLSRTALDQAGKTDTFFMSTMSVVAQAHYVLLPPTYAASAPALTPLIAFSTELTALALLTMRAQRYFDRERAAGSRSYALGSSARLWSIMWDKVSYMWTTIIRCIPSAAPAAPAATQWWAASVRTPQVSDDFECAPMCSSRLELLCSDLRTLLMEARDSSASDADEQLYNRLETAINAFLRIAATDGGAHVLVAAQALHDLRNQLHRDS